MRRPRCPDCGGPLTCFCPRCRGRKGGQARTERKAIAAAITGTKAAKQRRPRTK